MVKNSILFYVFLIIAAVITMVFPFNYGLLIWYGLTLIGNSIIIQKALTQKPPQKKVLVLVSSLFILLPICYILILVVLGGFQC